MSNDSSAHDRKTPDDVNRFEALATRTREIFEASSDKSRKAFDAALDTAQHEMIAAGELSAKLGDKLRGYIERDLQGTRQELETALKKFGTEAGHVGAGVLGLMQSLTREVGGLFADAASSMQNRLTYRTGEICGPGTLTCTACQKELTMRKTGHVPPCPACAATQFRRSY